MNKTMRRMTLLATLVLTTLAMIGIVGATCTGNLNCGSISAGYDMGGVCVSFSPFCYPADCFWDYQNYVCNRCATDNDYKCSDILTSNKCQSMIGCTWTDDSLSVADVIPSKITIDPQPSISGASPDVFTAFTMNIVDQSDVRHCGWAMSALPFPVYNYYSFLGIDPESMFGDPVVSYYNLDPSSVEPYYGTLIFPQGIDLTYNPPGDWRTTTDEEMIIKLTVSCVDSQGNRQDVTTSFLLAAKCPSPTYDLLCANSDHSLIGNQYDYLWGKNTDYGNSACTPVVTWNSFGACAYGCTNGQCDSPTCTTTGGSCSIGDDCCAGYCVEGTCQDTCDSSAENRCAPQSSSDPFTNYGICTSGSCDNLTAEYDTTANEYQDECDATDDGHDCDSGSLAGGFLRTGTCCGTSCVADGTVTEGGACCSDASCTNGNTCEGGVCTAPKNCFLDEDKDTYGTPRTHVTTTNTCPAGYVDNNLDCDDSATKCVIDTFSQLFSECSLKYQSQADITNCQQGYVISCEMTSTSNCDAVSYCMLVNPGAQGASIHPEPPLVTELCDNIDNDCNSTTVDGSEECSSSEWCDSTAIDTDGTLGVCKPKTLCYPDKDGDGQGNMSAAGSNANAESCPAGMSSNHDDCNDNDAQIRTGATEKLDCLDNNCDGTVDEGFTACLDATSQCHGTYDCKAAFDAGEGCLSGCTVVAGSCDNGNLCDDAHPCIDSSACVGIDCKGSVSCAGFSITDCSLNAAYGCSLSTCSSSTYKNTTLTNMGTPACDSLSGCTWDCGTFVQKEICSNGVDDDGVNGIDCQDSACRKASWTDAEVDRYNCLGTPQSGDVLGLSYQCSNGVDESGNVVDSVGLCCPAGQYPSKESGLGYWECLPSEICYTGDPLYDSCDYVYNSQFSAWIGSTGDYLTSSKWCVDPVNQKACCLAVSFGSEDYYSDTNNVVVY